jgi:hypothetical protein
LSVFEYSTSIISIVLGLAVAHLLSGVTAPLRLASTSRPSWIFLVWCVSWILVVFGGWYGAWAALRDVETLPFLNFLLVFATACVIYAAARILVPEFPDNSLPDLQAHFERVRRPFFICVALVFGAGSTLQLFAGISGRAPQLELLLGVVLAVLALSGAAFSAHRVQAVLAVVWPALYLLQQSIQPAITGR